MNLNGKMTNPGDLRTQVTLKRPVVSKDPGGFQRKSLDTVATVWAKWSNVHGSEVWASQAVQAMEPATVTIRYRADVEQTWCIGKGTDVYEIVSIDDIENRHEYLEIKVQRARNG